MLTVFMPSFNYFHKRHKFASEAESDDPNEIADPVSNVDSNSIPSHSDNESPALPDILVDKNSETNSETTLTQHQTPVIPTEPTVPSTSSEPDPGYAFALQAVKSNGPTPAEAAKKGEGIPLELRAQRVRSREAVKPKPVKRQHSDSSEGKGKGRERDPPQRYNHNTFANKHKKSTSYL